MADSPITTNQPLENDPERLEIELPDAGNRIPVYRANVAAASLASQAADDLNTLVKSEQPQVTPPDSGNSFLDSVGSIWSSTWGKRIVIASLSLSAALLIFHFTSHSGNSKSNASQVLSAPQAQMTQARVDQQLSQTSQALVHEGYDSRVVAQAKNQVDLVYGTRIVEQTASSLSTQRAQTLYVTGTSTPDHYASLQTINTHAYLSSLSQHPLASDVTRNSAAIHGLAVQTQE